jgi:hypothetical protein
MPIDMDMYDSAYEDGCNDCGDIGMPPPRLRPIYEKIGRSLEEILQLEVEIIEENTELEPKLWIQLYAERFRAIITDDPTLTKFQVKYLLYMR